MGGITIVKFLNFQRLSLLTMSAVWNYTLPETFSLANPPFNLLASNKLNTCTKRKINTYFIIIFGITTSKKDILNRCFMYVHIQISKIILRWYLICQFLTLLWLYFSSNIVAIPCMLAKEKSWKKKVIQTSLLLLLLMGEKGCTTMRVDVCWFWSYRWSSY